MKVLNTCKTKNNNLINAISLSENPEVLVIGVFHGDEPQGNYLIEKYLQSEQINENILFIPCLNPDGMELGRRTNANGVDLNRNFPTKNWGQNQGDNATCDEADSNYYGGISSASEIETRFIIDIIKEYSPRLILTLHSPYKIVNYDGPAGSYADKISQIIDYPVEKSIGYPTPGSFGTYCGVERNIPTITLELDEQISVEKLIHPMFRIFDIL